MPEHTLDHWNRSRGLADFQRDGSGEVLLASLSPSLAVRPPRRQVPRHPFPDALGATLGKQESMKPIPLLDEAALEAVRQWQFSASVVIQMGVLFALWHVVTISASISNERPDQPSPKESVYSLSRSEATCCPLNQSARSMTAGSMLAARRAGMADARSATRTRIVAASIKYGSRVCTL
jgi:hypothetical protein